MVEASKFLLHKDLTLQKGVDKEVRLQEEECSWMMYLKTHGYFGNSKLV